VQTEAHRAAQVAGAVDDVLLLLHCRDHRLLRIRVELAGVRLVETGEVTRHLDDHALEPEAQTEDRDALLAGVPDRADLALDPAHPEPARDADRVDVTQQPARGPRPGAPARCDP